MTQLHLVTDDDVVWGIANSGCVAVSRSKAPMPVALLHSQATSKRQHTGAMQGNGTTNVDDTRDADVSRSGCGCGVGAVVVVHTP